MNEAAIIISDSKRALDSQLDQRMNRTWLGERPVLARFWWESGQRNSGRLIGSKRLSKNSLDADAVDASRNTSRNLRVGIDIDDDRCLIRIGI